MVIGRLVESLALLASLVGIVLLGSYIWLAVVAFKRRILWGVLVLLLSPITAIIFACKYWLEAKKAFLVYIVCFILYFGYTGYLFIHLGGPEMFEMADSIEHGQLSEEDALNFMQNTIDRMDSSGLLDAQEKQDLAKMQEIFDELKRDHSRSQADVYKPSATEHPSNTSVLTPQTRPYERPRLTYQDVALSELAAFINMPIRVFDREGRQHNVTLLGMEAGNLKLRKNVGGGTFDFAMSDTKIERIQALSPEPT